MAQQVLLLGHSYVRHLRTIMGQYNCGNLDLHESSIQVHCVSGLSPRDKINLIHEAEAHVGQILDSLPDIDVVVIILGSNDLCSFMDKSATRIANELIDLGQTLLCHGVKCVAFAACLPRFGWVAYRHFCTLDQGEDIWTIE